MTTLGSSKIWILIPDWSRLKSLEPDAADVTRKISPLHFKTQFPDPDPEIFDGEIIKKAHLCPLH